jgi:CubicO group peptidase (beta-lactamase class C family)
MTTPNLSKDRLNRLHDILNVYVERGDLPGLVTLIYRRGETVVDTIGTLATDKKQPMQRDAIFRIASLTKVVTAVAAMILVEECRLRLDDPVDTFLPELADRQVLKRLDGPLNETVPAERPITTRDLLTLRLGLGHLMGATGDDWPILQALRTQGLLQGPPQPQTIPDPDEWIGRVGTLPLMHQPGEKWMYDIGLDILGVLIARVANQPFETFLQKRVFEPLGMKDTGFFVPEDKIDRLVTSYENDDKTGELTVFDEAAGGQWSRPPSFAMGSGGLVSTVDDYLVFCQMLLRKGKYKNGRLLSRLSVELMTTNQITPEQKAGAEIFLDESRDWGLGMSVITKRTGIAAVPGRFGWDGGLGTSAYTDPHEDMIAMLFTQLAWTSPVGPKLYEDFWTAAYAAIDD